MDMSYSSFNTVLLLRTLSFSSLHLPHYQTETATSKTEERKKKIEEEEKEEEWILKPSCLSVRGIYREISSAKIPLI